MTLISSFHPLNFYSSISHLNRKFKTLFNKSLPGWLLIFLLLSLNSSKTEFLLIGLKKTNLPKYTTLHLTPPTLLEILASSLTNNLASLIWPNYISLQSLLLSHSSALVYPALPRFVSCLYHCYVYLSLQAWLPYYKFPKSQLSRLHEQIQTLLLVLSLKRISSVISVPSYAFSTGSESLNASNTSSSHLPTKFSQLPNLHSFI